MVPSKGCASKVSSDISFQGSAYNILPVLFADSVNSQNVELLFDASLVVVNHSTSTG
ncbi:MAG: hypothetical protein H6559_33075 [Lewinellaceae bacterium]|nr:hypothetical protein [Lewinellaceae bacterium]